MLECKKCTSEGPLDVVNVNLNLISFAIYKKKKKLKFAIFKAKRFVTVWTTVKKIK